MKFSLACVSTLEKARVIPVDLEEYRQWIDAYVGEADLIDIPFINLTGENIRETLLKLISELASILYQSSLRKKIK